MTQLQNGKLDFLIVAAHVGPYLSVQPLEMELGKDNVVFLLDDAAAKDRSRAGLPYVSIDQIDRDWPGVPAFLRENGFKAIVIGTSVNHSEPNLEDLVSDAAVKAGIPVFAVEDFHGNYRQSPTGRLDGLFVEGPAAVQFHVERGIDPGLVHDTGNPRYDALKAINTAEIGARTRQRLSLSDERVMLWAGQPDDDNSFLALERLIEGYAGNAITLLFRAHPRDEIYLEGRYTELLATTAINVIDVSAEANAIGLYCAADLVVTQFSSAALEASHLGVPALLVLFDDLGKKYLRTNKGYELPPWCRDNCSFLIEDGNKILEGLERALFNDVARAEIIGNFQARFSSDEGVAKSIAEHIQATISQQV